MIRQPIRTRTRLILGIGSVAVIVLLYSWLSFRQHEVNPSDTTIPNLSQLLEGLGKIVTADASGDVWLLDDTLASFGRLLAGLALGTVLSFVIGMAMGCFPAAEAFFYPPVSVLARIPPTAMLAVYFVVFGTGFELFVAMIAFGIAPTLTQSIFQAARTDVTEHAVYKAYTLGASHFEVIWEVVYKQILPRILENIRLQIGPAFVFLIAAEWVTSDVGFGYRLRIQSRLLNMNVVYLYLMWLGLSGFVMDWLLVAARKRLSPWYAS